MAKIERPDCPECRDVFDYSQPGLGRRGFLLAASTGVAASLGVGAGAPVIRAAAPPTPNPAEELVRELFATLTDDQKKRLVLDYDHGSRGGRGTPTRKGTYNSALMNLRIGDVYNPKQQDLIERVIKATCSGDE